LTGNTEDILKKSGAMLQGHFVLASGVHSPFYWEKFRILQYPHYTEQLCRMIADRYRQDGIEVVAGPTIGGIIVAYEVARQLGVRGIFAEKIGEEQRVFRRGLSIKPGERVLLADDIATSGNSLRQVIAAINEQGGITVGIGILVNRSEHELEFGVPFFSCHRAVTTTYPPDKCPLCADNIPLVKPGGTPTKPA